MKSKKFSLFLCEEQHLTDAQMNLLQGGNTEQSMSAAAACSCGCQGTSSTADNKTANISEGKTTPGFGACDSIFAPITVTWRGSETAM
ncbi:MAG: TIGR04149 family rSAM-modified RiPP [Bacteroidales bacterium]|nr:TIGR04149 family rSAM-modified RiPP [Candidatus Minthousia equi]